MTIIQCGRVGVRARSQKESLGDSGQATVEIALLLPLLAIFLLLIVHVGIVVRQQVLVSHASREAARVASVENNTSQAIAAARKSVPSGSVILNRPTSAGSYLSVEVRDTVSSPLPILSVLLPSVTVKSTTVMRVEK